MVMEVRYVITSHEARQGRAFTFLEKGVLHRESVSLQDDWKDGSDRNVLSEKVCTSPSPL